MKNEFMSEMSIVQFYSLAADFLIPDTNRGSRVSQCKLFYIMLYIVKSSSPNLHTALLCNAEF